MPNLSGNLSAAGAGVQVSAYKQSRFQSFPGLPTDVTGITIDAGPVTADGGGAWALTAPTAEPYYLRFVVGALTVAWESAQAPSALPGTGPGPVPQDRSLQAWTYDPMIGQSTLILTNGQVQFVRLRVPVDMTVSTIWLNITGAGATPVAGQNFLGIFDATGARVVSASADALFTGPTNFQGLAVTPTFLRAGYYYVGFVANATTPPTLARLLGSGSSNVGNMGASIANAQGFIAGNYTVAAQAALPASMGFGSTLNIGGGNWFWAGLS